MYRSALVSDSRDLWAEGWAGAVWFSVEVCGVGVLSPIYTEWTPPLPRAANTRLSSQPCTHTHKHTYSQTLYKPGRNCCSVPTYCGGYRPKNKFGKLKVHQGLFPTDVLKLFQTVSDLCPALLSLTGLPLGQGMLMLLSLGQLLQPDPSCLFVESRPAPPPCKAKSFWGLAEYWLK